MTFRSIPVKTGGGARDYAVHVGPGVLERLPDLLEEHAPAYRYAVVSDSNVAPLHARGVVDGIEDAGLRADLFTFPAGEEHKSREEWSRLTDELLAAGFGRDCAVVAVGGGVTGDLAGFVAASFMRGIPVVQVPTSLVAMIDASVGGKTGVDAPAGKNLVGAFHPPRAVVADPEVVRTLPRPERAQGLAEALKHGAILDRAYLEGMAASPDALLDADPDAILAAVVRSVELKARVVSEDEREGGLRQILNFGHTLGHAVEAAAAYRLPHGDAIAVGMVLESRVGEALGVTEAGTSERLAGILQRFELPVDLPADLGPEELVGFTASDKKARGGAPRYVLLESLGSVDRGEGWSRGVDPEVVLGVLRDAVPAG